MYNALDKFLDTDTWHTYHALDERMFFQALHQIINHPDFNADQMAEYMRDKIGVDRDDVEDHYNKAINHFRDAAWAVREYLDAAKQ